MDLSPHVPIHSGTPVPCFSFACHYSNKADTSGGPPGVTVTLQAMQQISLYVYQDFAELNVKNWLCENFYSAPCLSYISDMLGITLIPKVTFNHPYCIVIKSTLKKTFSSKFKMISIT